MYSPGCVPWLAGLVGSLEEIFFCQFVSGQFLRVLQWYKELGYKRPVCGLGIRKYVPKDLQNTFQMKSSASCKTFVEPEQTLFHRD